MSAITIRPTSSGMIIHMCSQPGFKGWDVLSKMAMGFSLNQSVLSLPYRCKAAKQNPARGYGWRWEHRVSAGSETKHFWYILPQECV